MSYPHYTSGYWCAGAFLLYVDTLCGSNVVRGLTAALSRGSSAEAFFPSATGRSLNELWVGFQKTPVYTPIAAQLNRWHEALGFVDGKPPADYDSRLRNYFKEHPGATQIQQAGSYIESLVKISGLPGADGHGQMSFGMPEDTALEIYPLHTTFHGQKLGDPCVCHYTVTKASLESGWKLEQAWQSSSDG